MKTLKRTIGLLAVTAIGFGLLAVLFIQLNVVVKAAPTDQLDVCAACTYTTIQTAVNAANPGDTIRVAQGTYQDIVTSPGLLTSTVIITKDLTLVGGYSPDFQSNDPNLYETIVDGQNIGKGFYVSGSYVHIEGFTIINGYTQGILVRESAVNNAPAGATLVNNHIHDNVSGIVFYRAEITVMSNTIIHNSGAGVAGWESPVGVISNTIAQNSRGIWVDNSIATITGNQIIFNTGQGGIEVVNGSTVTIESNQILSNTADSGGGITLVASTQFTVTNNIIKNNQAQLYSGGGIAIFGRATGLIAYNDIISNSASHGGGIGSYDNGDLIIRHNHILSNTAAEGVAVFISTPMILY
jgi:nitrous oxidase accessory protein